MNEVILVERDGVIATVYLNRREKLNALTKPMWQALGDAFFELGADDSLRCIILRGAGEKAFAPGNDISEFKNERANIEQARAYGAVMNRTFDALQQCPHPILAQIHGICVGGGLEIAALCDLRICGTSSRFGIPIKRLGLVMSLPELQGLVQLAGRATTLELLLEGRILTAQEAFEKGLVTRVTADENVAKECAETARRIADGAPLVARWHKKFINRFQDPEPPTSDEIDAGYACYNTEDFQIGYQSFLNKTKPDFKGR